MNPTFPIIELVDRYVISQIKLEKSQGNQAEFEFYNKQLELYDLTLIKNELDTLHLIHNNIWALESDLKSGVEDKVELAEIGRRAIKIRDWNNKRISIKNVMAEKLGQGYIQDFKKDHLSE